MKYLLVVSDSVIDDIQEKYPHIEAKPIIRPMLLNEEGDSVYLSQPYLDVLRQKANEIALEEAVKNVRSTMDMIAELHEKFGEKNDV
jgi:hypothetical protein